MASLSDLGLKDTKPNSGFEPLPPGEYPAIVTKSEIKPTADKTGQRLNLTIQILSGPYQNRIIFDGLNVKNKSAQAEQIGRGQLKALCVAVNVPNPQTSEELHNKPFLVKLKIGKDQNGNPRNDVAGYKAKLTQTTPPAAAALEAEKNMIEQAFEGQQTETPKRPW
jgi:hypothetical protein